MILSIRKILLTSVLNNIMEINWKDGSTTSNDNGTIVTTLTHREAQEMLWEIKRNVQTLVDLGESYAHFQNARVTYKFLKSINKSLEGIS
jgi:hypothetical protein